MLHDSTLKFLKQLSKNNHKPWFDAHRGEYEKAKEDFLHWIDELIKLHGKNDPDIAELDARKCMFRINRDIRFSKDKTPYKKNFAASLDKGGKKSGFAGYYIHLEPGNSFFGGGIWQPPAEHIRNIRQEIDYNLPDFKRIVEARVFRNMFGSLYEGEGVKLTRLPAGVEADNPAADYMRFKSWMAITDISDEELKSKSATSKILKGFKLLQPFIQFINRSISV